MTTKKHAATLLILMVAALTGLASAQARAPVMITAQVPFDFVVNGRTIPAGHCVIRTVGKALTTLSISNGKHRSLVFPSQDQSPKASSATSLVFNRYGNRYFLAAITRAGKTGYELPANKLEKELRAQNMAVEGLTLLASSK